MSVLERTESAVEGIAIGLSFMLPFLLGYAFEYQPEMIGFSRMEVIYILCVVVALQAVLIATYKWQTYRLEGNQKCDVCDSVMEE